MDGLGNQVGYFANFDRPDYLNTPVYKIWDKTLILHRKLSEKYFSNSSLITFSFTGVDWFDCSRSDLFSACIVEYFCSVSLCRRAKSAYLSFSVSSFSAAFREISS